MPLPAMRARGYDGLAYCVVVNFATKPKTLETVPRIAERLSTAALDALTYLLTRLQPCCRKFAR